MGSVSNQNCCKGFRFKEKVEKHCHIGSHNVIVTYHQTQVNTEQHTLLNEIYSHFQIDIMKQISASTTSQI